MLSGMIGAGGLLAGLATGAWGAAWKASGFFWNVIGSSTGRWTEGIWGGGALGSGGGAAAEDGRHFIIRFCN